MKKELVANIIIACSGIMTVIGTIGGIYGEHMLNTILTKK